MTHTHIVSVDIGTSTIRACLYDRTCRLVGKCEQQVHVDISGREGELRVEIEPNRLFQQFIEVVRGALSFIDANASVCMAICVQRNSLICWNRRTLKEVTNFICWNDSRARAAVEAWNNSFLLKSLNTIGSILYFLTRQPRYMGAKTLRFLSALVTHRLMTTIEESKELQELLRNDELAFGCLDSWLLMRLTEGRVEAMESSCASSTGMFDPFINNWNRTVLQVIGFPLKLLPPLVDSVGPTNDSSALVHVNPTLFGRAVRISVILADQQAAHYGAGCFEKGDVKISLGTGTFVSVNTKDKPHASMYGLYPLVGWKINHKSTFLAEGMQHNTASLIHWAKNIDLFSEVSECSSIASSVQSSNGTVVFVPAFGGLQTPINDTHICAGFLGLRPDTTKPQMLRAILESIVFRVYQIILTIEKEVSFKITDKIRICGGVSANDFICQRISDILDRPVERLHDEGFVASRGAAMLAGLADGLWTESELPALVQISTTFYPNRETQMALRNTFEIWLKAVKGCSNFYS